MTVAAMMFNEYIAENIILSCRATCASESTVTVEYGEYFRRRDIGGSSEANVYRVSNVVQTRFMVCVQRWCVFIFFNAMR